MDNLILTPIPLDQLKAEISANVIKELQNLLPSLLQPQKESKYITRKEAAKKLGVSLPTLNEWSKSGIITGYRIASRVRYKDDEIEAALIRMKTGKVHG